MSNEFSYKERMLSYYPQVISSIKEFKAIIYGEYPEFEGLNTSKEDVIGNAYLSTMDEARVSSWEKILNIKPIENSTLQDRRDTIVARLRGQGKLNRELISSIVNAFTGGTANSWVEDGVLYVAITPPPNNKQYIFENVEQELAKKVPAHLDYKVARNYFTWDEIRSNFMTWQNVLDNFDTWNDIRLFVPFEKGVRNR